MVKRIRKNIYLFPPNLAPLRLGGRDFQIREFSTPENLRQFGKFRPIVAQRSHIKIFFVLFAFFAVGTLIFLIIDPCPGIPRVVVVRAGRGYSGNLGNPVLSKKIIRIAVFLGKLSHLRIVQRRQPAIANDRMIFAAFGGNQ